MKRFVKSIFKSVGVIFLLFVGLMIVLIIFTPKEVIEKRMAEDKATAISLSLTQTAEPTKTPEPTFTVTETPIPTNTIVPVENTPTSTPDALSYEKYLTFLCFSKLFDILPDIRKPNLDIKSFSFVDNEDSEITEIITYIFEDVDTSKSYVLSCLVFKYDDNTSVVALDLDYKRIFEFGLVK